MQDIGFEGCGPSLPRESCDVVLPLQVAYDISHLIGSFDAGYGSGNAAIAQTVVDRYPEGATVIAYYRPGNPEDSVLEPGATRSAWGPFAIGAIFLCVGIAGLLFMPRAIDSGHIHIR